MASITAGSTGRTPPARQPERETQRIGLATLCALALGLGIVTGLRAVLFRDLIGFIHNVMFLGQAVVRYDANVFTPPSPWGAFVILVPVIGALGVTFLVNNFVPEARGHGVPEVMDAIYYNGGRIRPVVAIVKSFASAIAIGTGAAVGCEGPIIQIGSAMDPPSRIEDAAETERTYPRQARTPFNVTGHLALAMMAGLSRSGLPVSVQFVGRYFAEAALFQVAAEWERAAGTDQKHPPLA